MISTESTTKLELFTLKRKEIALFFFFFFLQLDAFSAECHVLSRPAGNERRSSAVAFSPSEAHLRGQKFLASEHLHEIYQRPDILDVTMVKWVILILSHRSHRCEEENYSHSLF